MLVARNGTIRTMEAERRLAETAWDTETERRGLTGHYSGTFRRQNRNQESTCEEFTSSSLPACQSSNKAR